MSAFDGNRDGRIEPPEFIDQAVFQHADANHDGSLTRAEFSRIENPVLFNRADTNHDGRVQASEFEQEAVRERQRAAAGFVPHGV